MPHPAPKYKTSICLVPLPSESRSLVVSQAHVDTTYYTRPTHTSTYKCSNEHSTATSHTNITKPKKTLYQPQTITLTLIIKVHYYNATRHKYMHNTHYQHFRFHIRGTQHHQHGDSHTPSFSFSIRIFLRATVSLVFLFLALNTSLNHQNRPTTRGGLYKRIIRTRTFLARS